MSRFFIALLLGLFAVDSANASILFDFESLPVATHSSLSVTSGGLTATFSRTSGNSFDVDGVAGVPAGWGARHLNNFAHGLPAGDAYNVDFSSAIDFASIQFGDFGPSDDDTPVEMYAFSGLGGTGALIDFDSKPWLGSDFFPDFGTLNVAGSGIQSIQFFGSGPFHNSLYWDNLEVSMSQVAIPEPGSMLVWGVLGLAGVGMTNRRRKS